MTPILRTATDHARTYARYVINQLPAARFRLYMATKKIRSGRRAWLFLTELAGVVLVAFGISLWSVPAAVIVGGLVLVGAIEVRPTSAAASLAEVPPPIELLRQQAESAAMVINAERYGLGAADTESLARLSAEDCKQLIIVAKKLGASKT